MAGLGITMYEDFVMEMVQGGEPVIGLYPMVSEDAKAKFKKWKSNNM